MVWQKYENCLDITAIEISIHYIDAFYFFSFRRKNQKGAEREGQYRFKVRISSIDNIF